jgi:hypothetical protein
VKAISLFTGASGIWASEAVAKNSAPAPKTITEVRADKVFIERSLPQPDASVLMFGF